MPRAKSPRAAKSSTKPVADNNILQMPENTNGNGNSHNGLRERFLAART